MENQNLKIGYFSDLHTEFLKLGASISPKDVRMGRTRSREDFAAELSAAYAHCDVIVAAGDIGNEEKAVTFLRMAFPEKPVVYVMGNHDYWGGEIYATERKISEACAGTNIHYLHAGQTVEIAGVVFCGATLWTDYKLTDRADAMDTAERSMNDFRKIRIRYKSAQTLNKQEPPRKLKPQTLLGFHTQHLKRIKDAMAEALAQDKILVVVSHHLPSAQSLHFGSEEIAAAFGCQPTDVCYASHLDHLFYQPDAPTYWIHGHSHVFVDYRIGSTRVLSNPKGYAEGDDTGWEIGRHIEVPL